jgi:hypothetical protein
MTENNSLGQTGVVGTSCACAGEPGVAGEPGIISISTSCEEKAIEEVHPSYYPPRKIVRNEFGLICDGSVEYIFDDNGLINWRKMINPKFLVPHKQWFERNKKEVPATIDGLEDNQLLILLGGIKELAQVRGYEAVTHMVTSPTNDYVVSVCSIVWTPNYETEGRIITFSAIGDASPFNTNSFGKSYLGPIAENRAFVRSVRNFLRINIVSQEEVSTSGLSPEATTMDVSGDLLSSTMQQFGVSWEKVKSKLVEEGFDGAEKFNSPSDIPKFKQFELIERIKKKAAANKKKD